MKPDEEQSIQRPEAVPGACSWAIGIPEEDIARGVGKVLRVDRVYGNYRIEGTTSEGATFKTTVGIWKRMGRAATPEDFLRNQR